MMINSIVIRIDVIKKLKITTIPNIIYFYYLLANLAAEWSLKIPTEVPNLIAPHILQVFFLIFRNRSYILDPANNIYHRIRALNLSASKIETSLAFTN